MQIRSGVDVANLTDVGCERETNEDYYGYWEPESDEEFLRKGRLAIIADGMGGHQGGQEASRLAVEIVRDVYRNSYGDPQSALLAGLQAAHAGIQQTANANANLCGMGTTCTAISLANDRLYYAHVGDSRLYLVRKGSLTRLTRDHAYIAAMVEQGVIDQEAAATHPQRHVLTSALGTGDHVQADWPEAALDLAPGDILILCTDGLWNLVGEEELLQSTSTLRPAEACKQLVALARNRGAPDNITLQVLKVENNGSNRKC
jgi:protein phosphatase